MKMWIRSQDRLTLTNVNDLYIRKVSKGYQICTNRCNLGDYSTEEKALKVLDMIEQRIVHIESRSMIFSKDLVFQMPQDWSDEE